MHRTTGTVAVATCALVALLAAGAIVVVDGAVVSEGCICSDVRPRVGTGPTHVERFAVADTCAEIRAKGQCDEKWMLDTVKELEGQGYCMVSGRREDPALLSSPGGRACSGTLCWGEGETVVGAERVLLASRSRSRLSLPFSLPVICPASRLLCPLSLLFLSHGLSLASSVTPLASLEAPPTPQQQMTCGRCKCCKPVAETLRAAGLTSLVDAAAGTPYEEAFNDPAFMAAVLAPPAGTKVAPSALGSYILPPVVEWGDATYTAALLAAETASVMNASGGRLPVGAFKVVKGDIQACKAVVHAVDKAVA